MKNAAYYEAAAQLIPLLFITLVIEYRLLHQLPRLGHAFLDACYGMFLGVVVITIFNAEGRVLSALKSGKATGATNESVKVALILTGAALVFPVQQRGLDLMQGLGRRRQRWLAGVVGLGASVLLIAGVQALPVL